MPKTKHMSPNRKGPREGGIILMLRAVDENTKLDLFSVRDTVIAAVNHDANGNRPNKDGHYKLSVNSEEQARKLTKLKKLLDGTRIKVERHENLNQVKCIIEEREITDYPDDALAGKLKDQGVIRVRSIMPDRRLKIVTLKGTKVPPFIKVGFLKVKTKTYYRLPLVCRACKEIGHITEDCKSNPRCGVCSGTHKSKSCARPPNCTNCGGEHPPLDKNCPAYKQEKAIIKLQTDKNLHPLQARKQYRGRNKGRYIPLPYERAGDSDTEPESDETERESEVVLTEPVRDTVNNPGFQTPDDEEMNEDGNNELTNSPHLTKATGDSPAGPSQRSNKRRSKPKGRLGTPKRRSSRRTADPTDEEPEEIADDDDDDFIAAAERELLRRRLLEDI